ncbi:hypothetical protein FFF34_009520 [Inquilinus sp. KBS0705]|nr:hypothetical protein FFF34_009520 [Inquilinus sp. KBS0705]
MSLTSLIYKIWNSIRLLFNHFPADLKKAVHIGVVITENIKTIVESPFTDMLTLIIPGDIDDKIKQVLRAGIPLILTNLKLTDKCSDLNDPQEITRCTIRIIQNLDGDIKSATLHNLSVLISKLAADGQLTWSDGVCIVEWYYQNNFKHNARLIAT